MQRSGSDREHEDMRRPSYQTKDSLVTIGTGTKRVSGHEKNYGTEANIKPPKSNA